jgi:hypothetical protein
MKTSAWKLAPFAALFALGVLALLPGGATRPTAVNAAFDCDATGETLLVEIRDEDNDLITASGAVIGFSPDALDSGDSQQNVTDGSNADSDNTTGQIGQSDACTTSGTDEYTVELVSLPSSLDCDIVTDVVSDITLPEGAGTRTVVLRVENCVSGTATPTVTATSTTPTATVTTTPGTASSITVSAAPSTASCNGSSFVTVVVKTSGGSNVADGTSVTVTTNSGSVSPGTATTSGGGILTIFTAPATGGTAKITATSGGATGSADVAVNCGPAATATTAPPPPIPTASTGGGGGVISPPNTGDAGLSDTDKGIAWTTVVGILLIAGSLAGGLTVARRRA